MRKLGALITLIMQIILAVSLIIYVTFGDYARATFNLCLIILLELSYGVKIIIYKGGKL